ncbi:hypothetical protein NDU88_006116 [Pleurodeles waltl]|uniref:Uncharacterized protein n=1 Tax=Pleurodeles waltl TaxID=8319 RepID=A0AAV7WWN0_PLEWA|nr:hypothetical protein NDU88_006116 [Pleurodeles waltl]
MNRASGPMSRESSKLRGQLVVAQQTQLGYKGSRLLGKSNMSKKGAKKNDEDEGGSQENWHHMSPSSPASPMRPMLLAIEPVEPIELNSYDGNVNELNLEERPKVQKHQKDQKMGQK